MSINKARAVYNKAINAMNYLALFSALALLIIALINTLFPLTMSGGFKEFADVISDKYCYFSYILSIVTSVAIILSNYSKANSETRTDIAEITNNYCSINIYKCCVVKSKNIRCRLNLTWYSLILYSIYLIIFAVSVLFGYGVFKIQLLDYRTDVVSDAEVGSMIRYSEFDLSSMEIGDIILVDMDINGTRGTALRKIAGSGIGANGKIYIFTSGENTDSFDNSVINTGDIYGNYLSYDNGAGFVLSFLGSNIFYITLCISCSIIFILVILLYRRNLLRSN